MKKTHLLTLSLALAAAFTASSRAAATAIPASYALPPGAVNTNQVGFMARPYQTTATPSGTLNSTEQQLAGQLGPNLADLTGADANGFFTISTLVNWNVGAGGTVDTFPPSDAFPGIPGTTGATVNFAEEVLTYIQFPTAGTYTLGVNSDDGFSVSAAKLNPKDRFSAIVVGQFNGTRGAADTLFDVSVTQPGIYPFRLVYWQVGSGANLSFFSVVTNSDTTTNLVLINDTATFTNALKSFPAATVAPPYVGIFSHDPTGFTFTIQDDVSALNASSLQVKVNGNAVSVTTSKTGGTTTISYASPTLFVPGVTNTVDITYADNAATPHAGSATVAFVESAYATMPSSAALTTAAVDTTQRGFLYRASQIDSSVNGVMAANIAHAEAQLAGVLVNGDGNPFDNAIAAGEQPDGSYAISDVINFSFGGTELGLFTSGNDHTDAIFPGLFSADANNIAGEITTYLDLKAGFYTFAVHSADGFRVTAASNPFDAFGTSLGLFDYRRVPSETRFGVVVQAAGIYPVRLLFFRQSNMADNTGNAELEFYTVNKDGSTVLVNDAANTNAVKAYWKRTAAFAPYVKYAGSSSFISPFTGPDVGFTNVSVIIRNGSTVAVNSANPTLTIDGTAVTTVKTADTNGVTLKYTPTGLQLPRSIHAATLTYADTNSATVHTASWNFNLLRNYVLPAPLFFEDFESTPTSNEVGTQPAVPAGWVAENHTGSQNAALDPGSLNSDFYLGWVVVDRSWATSKDHGLSSTSPQVLNGVAFDEATNPLLVDHYMRAESDDRQNGPPGQIQYVTTKAFDLTGKSGVVIAFNSAYEKNQDDIVGVEVSNDNGTTWAPVFYWLQEGNDSQGVTDIIRDGQGKIDVKTTLNTSYGDVARYTDNGVLVGGTFGFFLKSPITDALAPYIEGRVNDDPGESKRVELFRIPQADNKAAVKFRFFQAGTSSWYWAVDNFGVYSVPSIVSAVPGPLSVALQAGKVVLSWPTAGTLQSAPEVTGPWADVSGASPVNITVPAGAAHQFYRLKL